MNSLTRLFIAQKRINISRKWGMIASPNFRQYHQWALLRHNICILSTDHFVHIYSQQKYLIFIIIDIMILPTYKYSTCTYISNINPSINHTKQATS